MKNRPKKSPSENSTWSLRAAAPRVWLRPWPRHDKARKRLIDTKGYTGGTVAEGGTALHSFFNLWKAFPGSKKRQVVKGIPNEIIERLIKVGGCSGHAEEVVGLRTTTP